VIITIMGIIPNVRPGLSADAEVTVAETKGALSIPIQSLTARRAKDLASAAPAGKKGSASGGVKAGTEDAETAKAAPAAIDSTARPDSVRGDSSKADADETEFEGVFVVKDGKAQFRRVNVGISSQKHFEVESGLAEGEMVVSGNFKAIRELRDGQRVKVARKAEKDGKTKEKSE